VTAVDGQSVDAVMSKLEQLRGGTASWRRLHASQYLTLQELLFGIDVTPDMQHSDWTVETPAGATVTRRLDAFPTPASEPAVPATRWLSSEALAGMAGPWRAVKPDHPLPISLTDFDQAFRSLRLSGTCTNSCSSNPTSIKRAEHQDFLSITEQDCGRHNLAM